MVLTPRGAGKFMMSHATIFARRALFCLFALMFHTLTVWAVDRTPPSTRRTIASRPVARPQLSTAERRETVVTRLLRHAGVRRCWARQLYRDPSTTSRRLRVVIRVDREGRVTHVNVNDSMVPTLASCISMLGYSVASVGAGEAFEAEATLTLERGE
jgi:hypothetical protein